MKFRLGHYCLFEDIEMKVFTFRYDHPVSESEREYGLFYSTSKKQLKDFVLHPHQKGQYYKGFKLKELPNCYKVETKAIYRSEQFDVRSTTIENVVNLLSKSNELFENFGLKPFKMDANHNTNHNESYQNYFKIHEGYITSVPIEEVSEIWEEYSKSDYDLPMPEGLPERKVIYPEVVE